MHHLRNIAIIAHVDHGKTTLVDCLLKQSGTFRANEARASAERIMDSMDLEREKGITIRAKNAAFQYKNYRVNLVDTPGHADFGGEVERAMSMIDGVLLVVDAAEGPQAQTRFVLRKALEAGAKPIVVINKIDRDNARPQQVLDQVFELFLQLHATDEQLDFPFVYASARDGYATPDLRQPNDTMAPLFEAIVQHVPPPRAGAGEGFQLLVANLDYSDYLGRIAFGKIYSGKLSVGRPLVCLHRDGTHTAGQITALFRFEGLKRVEIAEAHAGDIVGVTGFEEVFIGETIADRPERGALPYIPVDPPTIQMEFAVNDGPLAGRDGTRVTARPIGDARHFNNVLFNIMRGGVFERGYEIDPQDLHAFVTGANRQVAARHAAFFRRLKPGLTYPQLERLCREYLPLTFSRRHGDPSRPWNRFSIAPLLPDGRRAFWYEGNWRDLFQNWEALARSFPGYTAGMICKFLNASTADGYNSYRITRDGIEWEVVDPHDPWSFIGYWGDHQIIYLLKLLEILESHEPGALAGWLSRPIFAYANVPYRIKPYPALLANPKDTVHFDEDTQRLVAARVRECGADGRLVWDANGRVRLVTLTEKLLVPVLAKLSNFIPEAGIWLNTQRPEWNDANNALVGNGASVVTLCYLRRHLAFLRRLFESQSDTRVAVAREVAAWFDAVHRALQRHCPLLSRPIRDRDRKRVLDALGRAGSAYRERLYRQGFSGQTRLVGARQLLGFFDIALAWLDHSIRANRRRDGLFHAYNLVGFDRPDALPIRRLDLMLEGQVAALSAGCLTAEESLRLLRALRESALYRADQHSYLLYPDRRLPRFVEKNNIPARALARSALLRRLVADGNRVLVERDVNGRFHFQGDIRNAADVRRKLAELSAAGYERLVRKDARLVLQIFEDVFDHQSFTGRSGTFFGYEGMGCIYWHMVSKLLLAAQETFFRAAESGAPATVCRELAGCYHDIRAGLGDHKTPAQYGAFPMDPYSHTPGQGGARQPGLTGQVKEDILCRWGELGVFVEAGRIRFRPRLLREDEFLRAPGQFRWFDAAGRERRLSLPAGSLAFTYCHVPIVYRLGDRNWLTVFRRDGTQQAHDSLELDEPTSRSLFQRTGDVARLVVWLRG